MEPANKGKSGPPIFFWLSFLLLACFEQLDHFLDTGGTRFRSFGALDPFDVSISIKGGKGLKKGFGLRFSMQSSGNIG